jgi:hypothetical protein
MIRPATLSDFMAIHEIAICEARIYPELHPDREKIHKGIMTAISSAKHFAWVSENDNQVSGALIGLTSSNLWAQRDNCIVVLWKSMIVGDGVRMMKEFLKWFDTRRIIRVAGLVPDNNEIDPRVWLLAERLGFRKCGGAYLLYN